MKFIPLGGTDYVGASCYYISICGKRFLLDCGANTNPNYPNCPDFNFLLGNELLSLDDIDAIFLSHGHFDHVGSLSVLRSLGCSAPAYSTIITKKLMDALLVDKMPMYENAGWDRLSSQMRNEISIQTVSAVSYWKSIFFGDVQVTFYPAGHIPGAAMIYISSPEGSVLYTGDFQKESFGLTPGMSLPESLHADTLIMCGTHAKHPDYIPFQSLEQQESSIRYNLKCGKPVHLRVCQLTKGLETAQWISSRMPDTEIYLDNDIWNLGTKMEEACCAVFKPNFHRETGREPLSGIITIGSRPAHFYEAAEDVRISLHAVYGDCLSLIEKTTPSSVFLVHSPNDRNILGNYALQEYFRNKVNITRPICSHIYSNLQK